MSFLEVNKLGFSLSWAIGVCTRYCCYWCPFIRDYWKSNEQDTAFNIQLFCFYHYKEVIYHEALCVGWSYLSF